MATCNVQTTDVDLGLVTLLEGGFSQYDDNLLKVIQFAERDADSIRLVNAEESNRISSFWFTQEERLGNGFSASFEFFHNGTADGLGFVIQDIRTFDTVSGGGPALGFSEAFDSYVGVGFDFCFDRPDCTTQEIRVETKLQDEEEFRTQSVIGADFFGTAQTVGVKIDYLDDVNEIQVFVSTDLDNPVTEPQLTAVNITLANYLTRTDEFTFFGFTASNSESAFDDGLEPLELVINNLDIVQFNSGFRMNDIDLVAKFVEFGELVTFSFFLVDSCNEPLVNNADTVNIESQVVATMTEKSTGQVLEAETVNHITTPGQQSQVFVTFATLPNVITQYDIEILVNGVLVQQNPLEDIVDANVPEAGGLSTLGIALLVSLIAILALAVLFIARGWYKYKKKLTENADAIEHGKVKEQIDVIDQEVDYVMNPMVAPLDKLKERLAQNEKKIAELKTSQQEAIDSDYTVEQLQQENKELRAEMAELKKQQEYENAGNRQSTAFEKRVFDTAPGKSDFDENRV